MCQVWWHKNNHKSFYIPGHKVYLCKSLPPCCKLFGQKEVTLCLKRTVNKVHSSGVSRCPIKFVALTVALPPSACKALPCSKAGKCCSMNFMWKPLKTFYQSSSYYEWWDPTWIRHFLPKLEQFMFLHIRDFSHFLFVFLYSSNWFEVGMAQLKTVKSGVSALIRTEPCFYENLMPSVGCLFTVNKIWSNHIRTGFTLETNCREPWATQWPLTEAFPWL